MFLRPKYPDKIEHWLGKPLIKVFSGQRRTGNSFLLKLIQQRAEQSPTRKLPPTQALDELPDPSINVYHQFINTGNSAH